MGRYASRSQEVLYRDGKLVGFNAGYGPHSEHESEYSGPEQTKKNKSKDKSSSHPFNGEIVESPEEVNIIEFSDGNVWMTSDSWYYANLMMKPEEERREIMDKLINNDDRKSTEGFFRRIGAKVNSPEVVALWDAGFMNQGGSFNLISTNKQSSELIKTLYAEMQKGNVAISSDYSFMFKDRGLSFVLLDQLTQEDLMNKQLVDQRDEMASNFEKEYNEFLKKEGLAGYGVEMNYPLRFANVQIIDLNQTYKGITPKFYLELYHIENGDWDNTSYLSTLHMTGDEIKFLVPIAKSKEFEEFANSHSKPEITVYIKKQLEVYRQEQKIAEESGYQIGEDSLSSIATDQNTENVEKRSASLKELLGGWLHFGSDKTTHNPGGKGE